VLVSRDYADIVHLENPNVIEKILTSSRSEKAAYLSALITSGVSRFALAGPKVALAAMAVEALTDFGKEVSDWIKSGRIPQDFAGRPTGYQAWVELLQEIDSNPIDADRLKALKAMFLSTNRPDADSGAQILAYQLFQIAKRLSSGDLLVLRAAKSCDGGTGHETAQNWLGKVASFMGHGVLALVEQHEKVLVENGLLSPRYDGNLRVNAVRLTDLGSAFCRNLESYKAEE